MKQIRTLVITTAALVLVAASSQASLTTVNDLWGPNGSPGPEWNLYNSGVGTHPGNGIMEYLYGTFTRVNDANDIVWSGTSGGVSVDGVYASADQALYTSGLSGSPTSLILTRTTATSGAPSRSGAGTFTPVSNPFLFLDSANGRSAFSDPALSSGGVDRMVTFAVTGYLTTPGNSSTFTLFSDRTTHYVIGFEDGTDMDYNDLVVEVSSVAPVPEPTTMIAGALALLPVGASTVRMLRKRHAA
jgi:hypothetical protein